MPQRRDVPYRPPVNPGGKFCKAGVCIAVVGLVAMVLVRIYGPRDIRDLAWTFAAAATVFLLGGFMYAFGILIRGR